jgi:hypothetical protein
MTNVLSQKAVLATLSIGVWTARKFDRKVTKDVHDKFNASGDAGRYNKLLVADKSLLAIAANATAARKFHFDHTKPWMDEGPRVLPTAILVTHTQGLKDFSAKHDQLVDAFYTVYPTLVQEARKRLNGMFDEKDYPEPGEIRSRFKFEVKLLPVPNAEDFRITIANETLDEMRADVERRCIDVLHNAMADTQRQLIETVGTLATKLKGYVPGERDGTFTDAIIEHARKLASLLPAFNLTNDPTLEKIAHRIEQELCIFDAKSLREDEGLRSAVQHDAESILREVNNFMA